MIQTAGPGLKRTRGRPIDGQVPTEPGTLLTLWRTTLTDGPAFVPRDTVHVQAARPSTFVIRRQHGGPMQLSPRACILIVAMVGGLACNLARADQMFLKFLPGPAGEILGDSTDAQHPGEIVVLSYSIGVEADTSWTKGSGASVGKPNPLDLQFTAAMNRSVPSILNYITTGSASPMAILTLRSDIPGNRAGFEYARSTFEGCSSPASARA